MDELTLQDVCHNASSLGFLSFTCLHTSLPQPCLLYTPLYNGEFLVTEHRTTKGWTSKARNFVSLTFHRILFRGEYSHFLIDLGFWVIHLFLLPKLAWFSLNQSPYAFKKASSFVVILLKIVLLSGYKKNCTEERKRLVYDERYKI